MKLIQNLFQFKTVVILGGLILTACNTSTPTLQATSAPITATLKASATTAPSSTPNVQAATEFVQALTQTQESLDMTGTAAAIAFLTQTQSAQETNLALTPLVTPIPTETFAPAPNLGAPPSLDTPPLVDTATPTTVANNFPTAAADGFKFSGQIVYRFNPMAGATIRVWESTTGQEFTTTSDANGQFSFPPLPDGTWIYTATAPGNLVSIAYDGNQSYYCIHFYEDWGRRCWFKASPRDYDIETIRMARSDLLQIINPAPDANVATVGDISWTNIESVSETHVFIEGRFKEGQAMYTNRLFHEDFVRIGSLLSDNTVVGECYIFDVVALGEKTWDDPIAWTQFTLCR